jgi:hypothetical protein
LFPSDCATDLHRPDVVSGQDETIRLERSR